VQLRPIGPTLKAPGTKRLKLNYGVPLSNFDFKFNLRRYITAAHEHFLQCAAMDHASCHYQAALLEASGEGGITRDCRSAAIRFRRVAEVGTWMEPLAVRPARDYPQRHRHTR